MKVQLSKVTPIVVALTGLLVMVVVGLVVINFVAAYPMPEKGFIILGKEIRTETVLFLGPQPYYVFQYANDSRCWYEVSFADYMKYNIGDSYNETIILES